MSAFNLCFLGAEFYIYKLLFNWMLIFLAPNAAVAYCINEDLFPMSGIYIELFFIIFFFLSNVLRAFLTLL